VNPTLPAPVQAWYFMIMNVFVYGFLTWYLDNVLPDIFGNSKPFYFFLLPSYWGFQIRRVDISQESWLNGVLSESQPLNPTEDDDVRAERISAEDRNTWQAVKIVNLRKVYSTFLPKIQPKLQTRDNPSILPFLRKRPALFTWIPPKIAVANSSLTLEQGKLYLPFLLNFRLALLGQNGAGKTTTIAMLSGLTPVTSGDALAFGYSVKKQSYDIRKIMGICPQHDILFDDLTAREHIELYAGLKGVGAEERKLLIEERLKIVKLDTVADVRAVTYSGGMKRRLSLVISTIGDPKIIFMDEPTTGMDPVNRRHVWSFIEKFKKDRIIVLTTHSMEEADVLGDRIAIMSKGIFKAIGNSIHLKNKFGSGYRISVITDPANIGQLKEAVLSIVPEATIADESAGALIYQFPHTSIEAVPRLVQWLEQSKGKLVKNWGISQSTLEEVFLRLIRDN
jgi:ABC-type multidrug transport system ATPase subunit